MSVPQLLSESLSKDNLPRESRQSCLSANDKSNNEMIPGDVHRFPGICLTAEENSGQPQLGGSANSHRLKWGPLSPNEVSRTVRHVRKEEEKKERTGLV